MKIVKSIAEKKAKQVRKAQYWREHKAITDAYNYSILKWLWIFENSAVSGTFGRNFDRFHEQLPPNLKGKALKNAAEEILEKSDINEIFDNGGL